jgi:IPT/TIG domain
MAGIVATLAVGLVAGPVSSASVGQPTIANVERNSAAFFFLFGRHIGAAEGGTLVTITGSNLSGATAVRFGSTDASTFAVNSATSINAVSPPGMGTVDVTVTTPEGTSATSSADQFSYIPIVGCIQPADPVVTGIEPNIGAAGS